jgi:shikimate dehydrogenase
VITGRTSLYGVLGHPVSHSRSPAMQNAAFAEAGIDAVYVALPVAPERLADAVQGAHALGFSGLNVTVPHKQGALALCATVDPVAAAIGAVNTLRRAANGWEGFNTDAPACLALLEAGASGRARGRSSSARAGSRGRRAGRSSGPARASASRRGGPRPPARSPAPSRRARPRGRRRPRWRRSRSWVPAAGTPTWS